MQNRDSLPNTDKLIRGRQGSIAYLLIFMAVIAFVILPLAMNFILQMHSWIMLRQVQQALDQVLPSVQLCLDRQALATGELKLYNSDVQIFLEQRFNENLSHALREKMEFFQVQVVISQESLPSGHWLEEGNILYRPEITVVVGIKDHREQVVEIRRSISLIMD